MTTTTARQIASRFGGLDNDSGSIMNDDAELIAERAGEFAVEFSYLVDGEWLTDNDGLDDALDYCVRCTFDDGSALIINSEAWRYA